jgi:DNA-directed RNA polymerase specialized sigma24 family protein
MVAAAVKIKTDSSIETLYEAAFPGVARFVQKIGGNFDDAKDVFHDALVIFQEKQNQANFQLQQSPVAYLLGIAKHLWIRKHHQQRKLVPLSEAELQISIPADFFTNQYTQGLLHFLETAGQKCLDLLRAFYYQKTPVKQLAKTLGYANEHSASVQKYKCLEKVRNSIQQKSLRYEDFL